MPAHYGYYHWPGCLIQSFPADSEVKASASNVGDLGLIPGLRRSPGEGNGNPLQFPCRNFLENPMDREAWWTTVPGVTKELDTNYWSNINKWYLSWDLKDENRSGSPRSGWGEGRELQTNERIRPNVGQDATFRKLKGQHCDCTESQGRELWTKIEGSGGIHIVQNLVYHSQEFVFYSRGNRNPLKHSVR